MGNEGLPEVDPRDAERVPITLRVRLAWNEDECLAYTTNLSGNGLFAETREFIPEGTEIRVEFDLAEAGGLGRVYVDGVVARRIDEEEASGRQLVPGVGIRFDEFVLGKFDLVRFLTPKKGEAPEPEEPAETASDETSDERREATRVATGLPIAWGRADPPDRSGQLTNLSTSGAFSIQTDDPCEVGDKIYLMFELPRPGGRGASRVRAIAHVVRVVTAGGGGSPGMGVHFDSSSVDVETIRAFVEGRREWERQLSKEGEAAEADWVAPSKDLPKGIQPRRSGESAEPSRARLMRAPVSVAKPPRRKLSPEDAMALPMARINWTRISIVLGVALIALSAVLSITWVFSV